MTETLKTIIEYNGHKTIINCKEDEKMKDITNRFKSMNGLQSENLIFLCNGTKLNLERAFKEEAKGYENNELIIAVYEALNNENNSPNQVIQKSKDIICPICKEICRMSIINYKVILYECKNGHKTNNIFLEDFYNTQLINESSIKCEDCNNENKGSSFKKSFYKCLTCKKNLSALCKEEHEKKGHKTIDYDKKDYFCEIHNDFYNSYCKECRQNLCAYCYSEQQHSNHNMIDYKIIIPKKEKILEELIELKIKIDKIKLFITDTIKKLKIIMEKMDMFYQINFYIYNLNNDNFQNKNYQMLQNLNDIRNNIKISNVDSIINEKNISNKISKLLKVYNKIVTEEIDNKITNYDISENLQTLILIVLQQQNLMKNDFLKENNRYQNVFLINKKWLLDYHYEEIRSIIEQEEKIKEFIGYNNSKISIDWNKIKYNISNSNIESLIEIDKSINYEPQLESIILNKKQIFIPNEFIIVDEQICKLLKKFLKFNY
jgi:hypothetical protein